MCIERLAGEMLIAAEDSVTGTIVDVIYLGRVETCNVRFGSGQEACSDATSGIRAQLIVERRGGCFAGLKTRLCCR
jgi:hypothetical protein